MPAHGPDAETFEETGVLATLEGFLRACALGAGRLEDLGPLTLYLNEEPVSTAEPTGRREGPRRPLLEARPSGEVPVTGGALSEVHRRAAAVGAPVSIAWLDELHPELAPLVTRAGLFRTSCPLLVHDGTETALHEPAWGYHLEQLGADDPRLTEVLAVVEVALSSPTARRGPRGEKERDLAARQLAGARLEAARRDLAAQTRVLVALFGPSGAVSTAGARLIGTTAEIVGVATLPSHRRKGNASLLTASLTRTLRSLGQKTVFLAAASEEVARLYGSLGFVRQASSSRARLVETPLSTKSTPGG